MPYSKLTFYKMPVMTEEKNFIIEDFSAYLATLDSFVVPKFQYVKTQNEQTIKVPQLTGIYTQTQFMNKTDIQTQISYFNYLKVDFYVSEDEEEFQTDQEPNYYFIDHWNWKAENTAEISLVLDVLNMIGIPSATNKYCNWDEKTMISREHQNRFVLDILDNPVWNIDRKSEGIAPSGLIKTSDDIILNNYLDYTNWYFIFRNALTTPDDPNNYVELFICADADVSIAVGGNNYIIKNIHEWNRADSRIVRIIEWPYCPTDLFEFLGVNEYEADEDAFDDAFEIQTVVDWGNELKVKDLNFNFSNEFTPIKNDSTVDRLDPFYYHPISSMISDFTDDSKMNRSINYEPKLFHSDYFNVKYLYDATSKLIKFEDFSFGISYSFKIKFVPSNLATSKMLFKIGASQWIYGMEDFFQYIASNRNNDLPLYNVPYYNYLRTTDQWNNFKQNTQAAKSSFGLIGRILSKPQEGLGNIVSGISNMIFDKVNAEASVEETKNALQNQAASINGSDDLSLFKDYSGNKLHKIEYSTPNQFKQLLFDLFYYTGYIQNKMGVPNTSSRYWFNFVQCEPLLKNVLINMPSNVWESYKNKWREGCTVFHHHDGWDLEQEYENIEVDLL